MRYRVFLNGQSLPVQSCRVSAVPINRVWPGRQRPVEQTADAPFVSFDLPRETDIQHPVLLTVQVIGAQIQTAELRPKAAAIPFTPVQDGLDIQLTRPLSFTVEINGYTDALCVFANPPVARPQPSENLIYFGPGEHRVGILRPRDNQTVFLEQGAVVYGGILLQGVKNVHICGRGILDGSALKRTTPMYDQQPENLFVIRESENVTVEGIILQDAPCWAFTTRNGCRHIRIENVKLIGMWRYNADGFDICNSYDVELCRCFVRSYDDCLVVRAPYLTGEEGGCEKIYLHDNVLWCDWGKNMEVWSGHKESLIIDVTFERNDCIRVCHHAVSIDTWYGSRNTRVENILYRDIRIQADSSPLVPCLEGEQLSPESAAARTQTVISVAVRKLGKILDNQQCDETAECSDLSVRYKKLRFENITIDGDARRFVSLFDSSRLAEPMEVRITGCDLGAVRWNEQS